MIGRRAFLAFSIGCFALGMPLAGAQQPKGPRRIGLLLPNAPEIADRSSRIA